MVGVLSPDDLQKHAVQGRQVRADGDNGQGTQQEQKIQYHQVKQPLHQFHGRRLPAPAPAHGSPSFSRARLPTVSMYSKNAAAASLCALPVLYRVFLCYASRKYHRKPHAGNAPAVAVRPWPRPRQSPPPFAACQPFDRAAGFVASLSARHHRTRRPRRALQPFRQMSAATVRQSIRQGFRRPCAAPVSGSTWQPSASLSGDRAPVATIAGNAPQPSALAFLRAAHVRAVTPCRALARPFNTPCNRS